MIFRSLIFVVICALITGCSHERDYSDIADSSKDELARSYIQSLLDGDYERLNQDLATGVHMAADNDVWSTARSLYGQEELIDIRVIGYQSQWVSNGPSSYFFTYEHQFADRWIVTTVGLQESKHGYVSIYNFRTMNPTQESIVTLNQFSLKNKSITQYLFFAATCLVPVFVLTSFVVAIFTKFPRRKWLWLIFILLGLFKFIMNWHTGELSFSLLNINLLGFSLQSDSVISPWYVAFSLPVGSVLFWLKRSRLKAEPAQTS